MRLVDDRLEAGPSRVLQPEGLPERLAHAAPIRPKLEGAVRYLTG